MTPEKSEAWKEKFLIRLSTTGNVTAACKTAKVTRQAAYQARDRDTDFADAWKVALEIAVEHLEMEARRRAEKGVLEPVFYLGKKAGAVRKYSDTLLIFLLKAHKPEMYRDRMSLEHTGKDGKPLNTVTHINVYLPDNGRNADSTDNGSTEG